MGYKFYVNDRGTPRLVDNTSVDLSGYLPVSGGTLTGDLSTSGTITAKAFAGNATSATNATKATQDSAGQQINTTYIKNVSVNGRTITFTRGDETTFTITTQDTVTTNTSNWSVSNGANGWARDNSTGFTIQWGTSGTNATWVGFPRSFSSVLSVVSGQWHNEQSDHTDNILSWDNSGYTRSATGAFKWTWVAVGFS